MKNATVSSQKHLIKREFPSVNLKNKTDKVGMTLEWIVDYLKMRFPEDENVIVNIMKLINGL